MLCTTIYNALEHRIGQPGNTDRVGPSRMQHIVINKTSGTTEKMNCVDALFANTEKRCRTPTHCVDGKVKALASNGWHATPISFFRFSFLLVKIDVSQYHRNEGRGTWMDKMLPAPLSHSVRCAIPTRFVVLLPTRAQTCSKYCEGLMYFGTEFGMGECQISA